MALSKKVGVFTANTSIGNQVVSGIGFTPTVLILWTSNHTAAGNQVDFDFSFGVATGASEEWCAWGGSQEASTSNAGRVFKNDKIVTIYVPDSTLDGEAEFVSFGSGQFTINWTTALTAACEINYVALGGPDITNAKAGTFAYPATTGGHGTTDPGFQPDAVLVAAVTDSSTLPGTTTAHASLSLGWATSGSDQRVAAYLAEDNRTTHDTYRYQGTSDVLQVLNNQATIENADLAQMDATGFTLNWSAALAGTNAEYGYLAIAGPSFKVGTYTTQTGIGSFSVSGLGFQPDVLMNMSAIASGHTTDARFTFGAADNATQASVGFEHDESGKLVDSRYATDRIYVNLTAGTPTVDGDVSLTSLDQDGFTLNQDTADASGQAVYYIAIGPSAAVVDVTALQPTGTPGLPRTFSPKTAAGGQSVSLPVVTFTHSAGASLGVQNLLDVVTFNISPKNTPPQVNLPSVTFNTSTDDLSPSQSSNVGAQTFVTYGAEGIREHVRRSPNTRNPDSGDKDNESKD